MVGTMSSIFVLQSRFARCCGGLVKIGATQEDEFMGSHDNEIMKAQDAATVVVVRDRETGPFEVFMVRRHRSNAFLADRYVYPGGKVDPRDRGGPPRRVDGLTAEGARRRLGGDLPANRALGLFLAGVRETFEECGLLLARRSDETHFVDLTSDPAVEARFRGHRERLQRGEVSLMEVAELEDLVFPMQRLGYFAHWITPFGEARRYDTRFFICLAPENQRPLHDQKETTDGLWLTPQRAIERSKGEDFLLAPPTMLTLNALAGFSRASEALAWARAQRPPSILPHLVMTDGAVRLLLPGDPAFPAEDPRYPSYTSRASSITCLEMISPGRWRACD